MTTDMHSMELTLASILIQLVVIILVARLAGSAAAAIRQPRAVGEIVAGLMLGPSLFGAVAPDFSAQLFSSATTPILQILSQIGLILLMFQIGMDFEFGRLSSKRNMQTAILVALASISAPLVAGFVLGVATAPILAPGINATVFALFVAVAMAITAVPILGRILREFDLTRADVGVISITAAAANDIVGWVLLAGISAYAAATFAPQHALWQLGGLLALVIALFVAGRPLVAALLRRFPVSGAVVAPHLMAIIIALIFLAGIATQALGVFTIFGGFLVGLLFHSHADFVAAWRRQVGQFVLTFFLPIFFTFTGLRTDIWGLDTSAEWSWCGVYLLVAVVSKIVPVYLAARAGGQDHQHAAMIGVLMNTRALMELIVLNIGFSMGFIPQTVFTMLVIMAVATTIMTGPLMHVLLARAGMPVHKVIEA